MAASRLRPLRALTAAAILCAGLVATYSLANRRPPPPAAIVSAIESGRRIAVTPEPGARLTVRERQVATVLNVSQSMRYGQFVWDDRGVPAGSAWIRVDLDAQIISVFRAGHEIGTAVILHGMDRKPTPVGRFPILAKLRDHQSSIYDAAMPYTLRLTGDGVAIHGSNVQYGLATNGCIGIPTEFAASLFSQVKVGSEVLIVRSRAKRSG